MEDEFELSLARDCNHRVWRVGVVAECGGRETLWRHNEKVE